MDPDVGVHIELDRKFWVAVAAFTGPILVNAWYISLKLVTQLRLIARELEGNKEDHIALRADSSELKDEMKATCDSVQSVNEQQWDKLVEQRVDITKHAGRIKALEDKSRGGT